MRGERPIHRQSAPLLRRGADGRLRQASADSDIGDLWAEQRRIRLNEAIEEDRQRTQRKQQRRELVGRLKSKLRRVPKAHNFSDVTQKTATKKEALPVVTPETKEIVVQLSMPKVGIPNGLRQAWQHLPKRKLAVGIGVFLAVVAAAYGGMVAWTHKVPSKDDKTASGASTAVLDSKITQPSYPTITPSGKDISALGGWGRVSPPEANPVFAYADTLNGVPITVSEQPIPDSFNADPEASLAKLAQQSGATQKLQAGGSAFLGTTEKGLQTVFFIRNDLLILIRANNKVPESQWVKYVNSLQ